MNIFKYLKNYISREKSPKTSKPDQADPMNQISAMGNQMAIANLSEKAEEQDKTKVPQSETNKMLQKAQSSTNANSSLDEMYRELKAKKGGFLNMSTKGKLYTSAINALGKVNQTITKRFTAKPEENFQLLNELDGFYHELIQSCSEYLSYEHPTPEGKIRKELIEQVLDRAGRDSTALSAIRTEFCSLSPEEQQSKSIPELLRQSRSVRISVKNLREIMTKKESGGQVSEVVKLDGDNASITGADGTSAALNETFFYKPEDEIDNSQRTIAAKIMENVMSRYSGLTDNDREIIRNWAEHHVSGSLKKEVVDQLSDAGKLAINNIYSNISGVGSNLNEFTETMGYRNDEKINMTRRNVATSRVAALLGLSDLVAESQTAEIYDESTGNITRGNIMKQSKYSKTASSAVTDIFSKAREKGEDPKVGMTGGFQRDLMNLQVLDVICGQHDRHQNNYFVNIDDDGNLSGLQGIDNDMSFGYNEQTLKDRTEGYSRTIYDDNNDLTIPYMDKKLAERIKQIDPEVLKFTLQDLLKPEEINMAVSRLTRVKEAISKVSEDSGVFLDDDQWNDDTAQKLLEDSWMKARISNDGDVKHFKSHLDQEWLQRNYLGDLLTLNIGTTNLGMSEVPDVLKKKKEQAQ